MSEEFEVGGNHYHAAKMSAFDAYNVARKWAPILIWLAQSEASKLTPSDFARAFVATSAPVPNDDSEYALGLCLNSVSRRSGVGLAPVRVGGKLMFQDLTMPELLELVYYVLRENNIISFFAAPPAIINETP